jgi:hypothetical protein
MDDHKLHLHIDPEDLADLERSDLSITLAEPLADHQPNVAWVVFDPFEVHTVSWSENYGIYASNSQYQKGVVIEKMSHVPSPAQDSIEYLSGRDAVPIFESGDDTCGKGSG